MIIIKWLFEQAGGPFYTVELGRRDGRVSTKASVQRSLPSPNDNFDKLMSMFAKHGLDQTDLVALSGTLPTAYLIIMAPLRNFVHLIKTRNTH